MLYYSKNRSIYCALARSNGRSRGRGYCPGTGSWVLPFIQLLPSLLPTRPPEICGTLLPLMDILTLVKFSHLALQRAQCLLIVESSQSPSCWRLMISLGGSQRKKTEHCSKSSPPFPIYSTSSASSLGLFVEAP